MTGLPLLRFSPQFRDYVWGGARLRPGMRTAEAWVIYEHNPVAGGALQGHTLGELAGQYGEALLGQKAVARTGRRFPLLIKLLDIAQWLSVQVHPNDQQAARLEGPGQFGKTEAWHLLEADPGASLLAGVRPGTTAEGLAEAMHNGTVTNLLQEISAHAGDTLFISPGTLHALGPGLLIYEVQQSSDLTYRVFDWNRPLTGSRVLHIDKSLAVANPAVVVDPFPLPAQGDGDLQILASCEYFTLEMLAAQQQAIDQDTAGETFHALTIIEGRALVRCGEETVNLGPLESILVPASSGAYRILPETPYRMLKASC